MSCLAARQILVPQTAEKTSEPLVAPLGMKKLTTFPQPVNPLTDIWVLPQPPDTVGFKDRFVADNRCVFRLSLSDQHAVKWVLVRTGQ